MTVPMIVDDNLCCQHCCCIQDFAAVIKETATAKMRSTDADSAVDMPAGTADDCCVDFEHAFHR